MSETVIRDTIGFVERVDDTIEGYIDRIDFPYSDDPIHWEPEIHGRITSNINDLTADGDNRGI